MSVSGTHMCFRMRKVPEFPAERRHGKDRPCWSAEEYEGIAGPSPFQKFPRVPRAARYILLGLMASPPTTPAPAKPFEKLTAAVDVTAKILAIAGIGLYGLGILVTNTFLAKYGVVNFAVLKPQAIFTGIWTVALFAVASLPTFAVVQTLVDPRLSRRARLVQVPVLFLFPCGPRRFLRGDSTSSFCPTLSHARRTSGCSQTASRAGARSWFCLPPFLRLPPSPSILERSSLPYALRGGPNRLGRHRTPGPADRCGLRGLRNLRKRSPRKRWRKSPERHILLFLGR